MSGQQNEFSSFKLLLKQVYSAHTSKVKELENEVTVLKEKLTEKDRELYDRVSECKRCNELEEAFKNCKKALHEQSKLFENFGQKFSIFNSSSHEKQDSKFAESSFNSVSEIPKISRHSKTEISVCDENVSSVEPLKKNLDSHNINEEFKVSAPSNSNLLKKVMCDDGTFENSLYTETFPPNLKTAISNGKSYSAVLVPESLAIGENPKTQVISLKNFCGEEKKSGKKSSVTSEQECSENTKVHQQDIIANCKRLSSETLNEDRIKRCNKGDQVESNFGTAKFKSVKLSDTKVQKDVAPSNVLQTSKMFVESKSDTSKLKYEVKDPVKNSQIPINESVTTRVSSDKFIGTPKNNPLSEKNFINEVKNKGIPYEISPSLLTLNANAQAKLIDLEAASNDNDDFQEQLSSSKAVQSEESWETCDKRKLQKKNRIMKSIKSTSKFKMTLDAPPLNCKKPNYKQIKLSKSLFQPKNAKTISSKISPEKTSLLKGDVVSDVEQDENDSPVILENFQTSTPHDLLTSRSTFDIDATFIPENFKIQLSESATTSVKKNAVEKLHLKNGNLFSNISFPVESKSIEKLDSSKKEVDIEDSPFPEDDAESERHMDSFNRLPVQKEPNYKYKNDVVRKKSERKLLNAFDCKECEKYYAELGLSDKERKVRMKKCSRHRAKFAPPSTPDHFWELDFPDTEECKARGYMDKTQKIKLKNLCDI